MVTGTWPWGSETFATTFQIGYAVVVTALMVRGQWALRRRMRQGTLSSATATAAARTARSLFLISFVFVTT